VAKQAGLESISSKISSNLARYGRDFPQKVKKILLTVGNLCATISEKGLSGNSIKSW